MVLHLLMIHITVFIIMFIVHVIFRMMWAMEVWIHTHIISMTSIMAERHTMIIMAKLSAVAVGWYMMPMKTIMKWTTMHTRCMRCVGCIWETAVV